jgi:hypothetical protein
MIKAAAILILVIALSAAGYLIYQSTLVRSRYNEAALNCRDCTAVKEAFADNWKTVESNVELLKSKGKYREAEKYAKQHAMEKPVEIEVPCVDCDTPAPEYSTSSAIAVVGLILSTLLFGAGKPGRL